MRFSLGMAESIDPMWSFINSVGHRLPSGPDRAKERNGRITSCPSSSMSSGRLFLDRGARQHCPSPLHRQVQIKSLAAVNGTKYHRTVNCVLTVCLSPGGNPRLRSKTAADPSFARCMAPFRCRFGA